MIAGSFEAIAVLTGGPLKVLQGSAGTSSEATASSRVSSDYDAVEAWDGIVDGSDTTANAWISNNSNPPDVDGSLWWQLDFSSAKDLRGFRFQSREASGYDQWPDDVKVLGKTSAQSWAEATTLYDGAISGASGLSPGDWCAWHDFTDWGEFDAYRIEIHSAYIYAGAFDRVSIQEFEFKEYQAPIEVVGVTAGALESVATLTGLPRVPFKANATLSAGTIQATTIPRTRQFWRVTLTGHADGVANVELPASSVQVRARSGDPTYLQATIPGMEYATQIADRENGQIVVEIVYKDSDGNVLQAEEIARVDMDAINTYEGGQSRSITIEGRRTTTHAAKAVTLTGTTYRSLAYGRLSCRVAKPDPYLRPGDTVTTDHGDTFAVDSITYILSPRQQSMEIAQA